MDVDTYADAAEELCREGKRPQHSSAAGGQSTRNNQLLQPLHPPVQSTADIERLIAQYDFLAERCEWDSMRDCSSTCGGVMNAALTPLYSADYQGVATANHLLAVDFSAVRLPVLQHLVSVICKQLHGKQRLEKLCSDKGIFRGTNISSSKSESIFGAITARKVVAGVSGGSCMALLFTVASTTQLIIGLVGDQCVTPGSQQAQPVSSTGWRRAAGCRG